MEVFPPSTRAGHDGAGDVKVGNRKIDPSIQRSRGLSYLSWPLEPKGGSHLWWRSIETYWGVEETKHQFLRESLRAWLVGHWCSRWLSNPETGSPGHGLAPKAKRINIWNHMDIWIDVDSLDSEFFSSTHPTSSQLKTSITMPTAISTNTWGRVRFQPCSEVWQDDHRSGGNSGCGLEEFGSWRDGPLDTPRMGRKIGTAHWAHIAIHCHLGP